MLCQAFLLSLFRTQKIACLHSPGKADEKHHPRSSHLTNERFSRYRLFRSFASVVVVSHSSGNLSSSFLLSFASAQKSLLVCLFPDPSPAVGHMGRKRPCTTVVGERYRGSCNPMRSHLSVAQVYHCLKTGAPTQSERVIVIATA